MTLSNFIESLVLILTAVTLVPVVVLFAEIAASFFNRARIGQPVPGDRPSCAIIVPAHNEAAGIKSTLDVLKAQIAEGDIILVVADNCEDNTARIAASSGVTVVERCDRNDIGKGHALDYGIRSLSEKRDIVVFVDSDCKLAPNALDALIRLSFRRQRPAQAAYLMTAPSDGAGAKLREFAFKIKNYVRPLGGQMLGIPAPMTGSGMAVPWDLLRSQNFATSHLAEDTKLGLQFSRSDNYPLFCPQALVLSEFPTQEKSLVAQKDRWEAGHIGLLRSEFPSLVLKGIRQGKIRLIGSALDLLVLPIVMLFLITAFVATLGVAVEVLFLQHLLGCFATIPFLLLVLSIFLSWVKAGRDLIGFKDLQVIPMYIISKSLHIPRLLTKRTQWRRTDRG
ncbi:glycosyltransferase family 2 protein [Rhizobium sp. L80/93]|uniref:glycosyltransferase family 2 protein n=1 Tax=unclassified Rhizobium TaxID=2613769 RepID=UPI001AD9E36E|nr:MULTISPECIES: glycosyltransferase [unclassified Rhizobium]MBO9136786.1 glycosyltransferase [Rhizobium sp. B209b/85]MBO9188052.1 glycosyltransferase [Rhizobium sp. E27B/91]QXZ99066.1 glycosyltransferase [Rhizobium sp. B230/85]